MERKKSSLIIITETTHPELTDCETAWLAEEMDSLSGEFERIGIFDLRLAEGGIARFFGKRWLTRSLARGLQKFMRAEGFDAGDTLLYTTSMGQATVAALQLATKGKCGGVRSRVWVRDVQLPDAKKIATRCLDKAEEIVADSEFTRQRLSELWGKKAAVKISRRRTMKVDGDATAKHHGREEHRLTFVSADSKGFEATFKLLRQLAVGRPSLEVKLVCFGGLDEKAMQDVPTNLRIERGEGRPAEMYGREPVDWFMAMDNGEGVSGYLVEALSYGVPAVATIGGGVDEIVDDDNGLLLPEDCEPEEFVRGLLPYLDSEPRYLRLRSGAFESSNKI